MFGKNKSVYIGVALALFAVVLFLIIHGTRNLLLISKINSIWHVIPIFDGIKIKNEFLTGYLIDIIWFFSLNLILSSFDCFHFYIITLIIAVLLEILQLKFRWLGTFDFIDIIIYFCLSFMFSLNFVLRKK